MCYGWVWFSGCLDVLFCLLNKIWDVGFVQVLDFCYVYGVLILFKDRHWEFICKFLLCDLIKILAFSTLSFCFSFFLSVAVLIRMLVCFLLFWNLGFVVLRIYGKRLVFVSFTNSRVDFCSKVGSGVWCYKSYHSVHLSSLLIMYVFFFWKNSFTVGVIYMKNWVLQCGVRVFFFFYY